MRMSSGIALALCCVVTSGIRHVLAGDERPNIVIVLTDDQGYGDLGVHGNSNISTPNLDRFARESLEMTRFYVNPLCSPSRASLMTGRYHLRTGVLHTSRGAAKMFGDELTIAELLAHGGYRTGIFGKWHLGDNYPMRPQDQGFQEVLIHKSGGIGQAPDIDATYFQPILWHNGERMVGKSYCTDIFFDAAIGFIQEHRDQPFFVYLPTNVPHTPLEVGQQYAQRYLAMGLGDRVAKLYGMIANLDENFGRLLRKLDELALAENTLVIFMSDNGGSGGRYNTGLRGAKGTVYEGGIRVPFFVRWPARLRADRKTDRIAAHIDLLPTLLAAAGLELPEAVALDGTNLLPLWSEQVKPPDWPDRTLFVQHIKSIVQQPFQNAAAYTQQYKLVAYPKDANTPQFQPDLNNPKLELYDTQMDPAETQDLAAEKPAIVAQLRRRYLRWFAEMNSTRAFRPGVIHLGSEHENPSYLCRYQDGHYPYGTGAPIGWPVRIVSGGGYRITLNWGKHNGGVLGVQWKDKVRRFPLEPGRYSVELELTAGEGMLDVWFENTDRKRIEIKTNNSMGDVLLELLNRPAEALETSQ